MSNKFDNITRSLMGAYHIVGLKDDVYIYLEYEDDYVGLCNRVVFDVLKECFVSDIKHIKDQFEFHIKHGLQVPLYDK